MRFEKLLRKGIKRIMSPGFLHLPVRAEAFSLLPRREGSPLPLRFRGFTSLQDGDEGVYRVKICDPVIMLDFAITPGC
jgi:hypothetical protein